MTKDEHDALMDLHAAWVQFINCWADPFDDPKAEAEEEKLNVRRLGYNFSRCYDLGLFNELPPAAGGEHNTSNRGE